MQMLQVITVRLDVHQDIVEEHNRTFAQHWCEGFIHNCLKCCQGTRQSKGHNVKLVMTTVSMKCTLVFLSRGQPNLMVARSQIQFREPRGTRQFIEELFNHWKWILRLNCQ